MGVNKLDKPQSSNKRKPKLDIENRPQHNINLLGFSHLVKRQGILTHYAFPHMLDSASRAGEQLCDTETAESNYKKRDLRGLKN